LRGESIEWKEKQVNNAKGLTEKEERDVYDKLTKNASVYCGINVAVNNTFKRHIPRKLFTFIL
jgi:hypothetical protein